LAAETGGSLGFLLRPASCRAAPSWAEVRLLVSPVTAPRLSRKPSCFPYASASDIVRRLRLEVLHGRGGVDGQVIELELSDEADSVRLAARLADSASPARAARA
jgi:hypothetical protein